MNICYIENCQIELPLLFNMKLLLVTSNVCLLIVVVTICLTKVHGHSLDPRCDGPRYDTIPGPKCMAYFRKWEYNKDTNKCQQFIFGGCPSKFHI